MTPERRISVLLVEDNQADVYLIEESLHQHGIDFDLVRFDNGDDALLYLRPPGRGRPAVRPDVILLDLHLPGIEGHEILKVIRDEPWLAGVPIAVISGAPPERVKDLDLGGSTCFIHKSMDVKDYLDAVGSTVMEVCHRSPAD
jgi:CheY-like chemotaxis protein